MIYSSVAEAAQEVLRREGKPLPANVIGERINDLGLFPSVSVDPVVSLTNSLSSYVLRLQPGKPVEEQYFYREKGIYPPARQPVFLYGLTEWKRGAASTIRSSSVESESPPPANRQHASHPQDENTFDVIVTIRKGSRLHEDGVTLVKAGKSATLGGALAHLAEQGTKAIAPQLEEVRRILQQLDKTSALL